MRACAHIPFYCCCIHFSSVFEIWMSSAKFYKHQKLNKFTMNLIVVLQQNINGKENKKKMFVVDFFGLLLNTFHFRFLSFNCTWKVANKATMPAELTHRFFAFKINRGSFCYLIWVFFPFIYSYRCLQLVVYCSVNGCGTNFYRVHVINQPMRFNLMCA